MKTYIKKKSGPKKKPSFRTPDHFKGKLAAQASKFSGKGKATEIKFNPGTFKVQHRG